MTRTPYEAILEAITGLVPSGEAHVIALNAADGIRRWYEAVMADLPTDASGSQFAEKHFHIWRLVDTVGVPFRKPEPDLKEIS